MTVAELIKQLQDMPQDLLVYVYADHGQATMKCCGVAIGHVDKGEAGKWWIENPQYPFDIDYEVTYEQVVTIFNL